MQTCRVCGETNLAEFYVSNKTKCKQCCIEVSRQRYHNLLPIAKVEYKQRSSTWQDDNMLLYRWRSASRRAAQSNVAFSITEQQLADLWKSQQGLCYYTGQPMKLARDNNRSSVSIERKDPALGYCQGNVVLCCSAVNIMKNDLSIDEFKQLIVTLSSRVDTW